MNKKGFSLVEVLTVIVVLAIIMAIAVPRVLVSIDNVRKETFRTGATSIVDTVKLVYSQKYEKMTEAKTYTFNSGNYDEDSEKLNLKGDLPYGGQVYLGIDGKIALAVISPNKKWCAKKGLNDKEITIEDYNPGDCIINIDDEIIIGENYYITITVSDENKWTKTKKVKIESNSGSGNIANGMKLYYKYVPSSNSSKKAKEIDFKEYSRTFEAEENGTVYAELRSGETKIVSSDREIIKIDNTSPTCKFNVSGTKGDDDNDWYTSDEVKVTLKGTDDQSGINTTQTKINNSNNSYNYIIVKNDGTTEVNATVYDNAGNEGTCSTTIKKDSTTPSCTLEVKLGTIGENGWYTSNVTVGISSVSTISGVSNSGINTSKTPSYGVTTFIQTHDTTSTTIYGHVKNNAGNEGTCSTTIKKDSTPPIIKQFAIYDASISSEKDNAGVARVPYYTPAVKAKDDTSGINYVSFYKPETSAPDTLICADYIKSDSSIKLYSSNDSLFTTNSRKLVNPITNPVTDNVIGTCKNIGLSKASYTLRAQVCDAAGNCKTSEEEQKSDIQIEPVRIYVHQLYTKLLGRSAENEEVVSNWISQFYNNDNFDEKSKTLQNIGYCFTMSKTDEVKTIRDGYNKDNDSYKNAVCTGLVGKTCSFNGYTDFENYVKAILATDGIYNSANALGISSNKSTTYNCPE